MFQIISDGSCDLSPEQLQSAGVEVVPFYVSLDGKTYMPAVQDYLDAFEKHLSQGDDVLCYCITEKFSGSFGSATAAKELLEEKYPERKIRVVNSTLVTGLQGLLLLELARYRSSDYSIADTAALPKVLVTEVSVLMTLAIAFPIWQHLHQSEEKRNEIVGYT